jgi:hypothetical protein
MADEQGKTDRPEGQHGGPRTPSPFTVQIGRAHV